MHKTIKDCIVKDVDDYGLEWAQDVLDHGLQSGIHGDMVYYKDTNAFFEQHNEEINTFLASYMHDFGATSIADLLESRYDPDDPLCLGAINRNQLSWIVYEEVLRSILDCMFA